MACSVYFTSELLSLYLSHLKLQAEVGPEILSDLVTFLHPGYYKMSPDNFPYERHSASRASLTYTQGTFYYGGAFYGGHPDTVIKMLHHCWAALQDDMTHGLVAIWNEESHLNRYLALQHPPSLVLSPEYCWASDWSLPPEVRLARVLSVAKNNAALHADK